MHNLDNLHVRDYLEPTQRSRTGTMAVAQSIAERDAARIDRTAAAEIAQVIARHNPGKPKAIIDATARLAAALAAAAAALPLARQKKLLTGRPKQDVDRMVSALLKLSADAPTTASALPPVEPRKGTGFGALIDLEEGRRRLDEYATPMRLEDWAGSVAGPVELERDYGISRSTLHNWQRRGAVIGLLKGERKHVFPLRQFVDGRPVEGIARIVALAPSPRAAWLWLVQDHPGLGNLTAIDWLRAGEADKVVEAAEEYFDQP